MFMFVTVSRIHFIFCTLYSNTKKCGSTSNNCKQTHFEYFDIIDTQTVKHYINAIVLNDQIVRESIILLQILVSMHTCNFQNRTIHIHIR